MSRKKPDDEKIGSITPFGLRMPADVKAQVEAAATTNNRSMNAEIVARLEQSFILPDLKIPEDLAERMLSASREVRASRAGMLIDELSDLFPPPPKKRAEMSPEQFYGVALDLVVSAAEEDRPRLMAELVDIMRKMTGNPDWQPPGWRPEE